MNKAAILALAAALVLTGCGKKSERMQDLVDQQVAAESEAARQEAQANAEAGESYLKANAERDGVETLAPGIQYKVIKSGPPGGASPRRGDLVTVNYEGALLNGAVFDSSYQRGQPAQMNLDGLVPGWMEALPKMKVGDEWLLWLAPDQGYGSEGAGPIPPGSVLVFRIELLDVSKTG